MIDDTLYRIELKDSKPIEWRQMRALERIADALEAQQVEKVRTVAHVTPEQLEAFNKAMDEQFSTDTGREG